ncbi:hypothetical protein G9A89_007057 [Geosiphon pyriformis]|nr:hypothetical protein G9A89_007057 [Geosiphon pyriformis]
MLKSWINLSLVYPHAPEDLNSAIQHVKRYKMAMEEANRTKLKPAQQLRKKLTNSQRSLKIISPINNNNNSKDINHLKDKIKITLHHFLITSLRIAITLQQDQQNKSNQHYPPPQQFYYQPPLPAYYPPRPQYQNNYYQPALQPIQQQYQQPPTQHYQVPALRLYDLFYTCENVLQNPILQPLKIQYIGKLTELKFQQFSDQISSIILDYYLEITDSTWTSTELSLEEEIMLPDEIRNII